PFVASAMSDPVRRAQVVAAVGKVGTAEQIAECAAWLISPGADFVHGSTLIADGGVLMHLDAHREGRQRNDGEYARRFGTAGVRTAGRPRQHGGHHDRVVRLLHLWDRL